MARIVVTVGEQTREFPVNGSVTIGRSSASTIQINEAKASRQHARISVNDSEYQVEDLNSSNGTRVNGRKIDRCALKHGDTITIGATKLVFEESLASLKEDGDPEMTEVLEEKSGGRPSQVRPMMPPPTPNPGQTKPSTPVAGDFNLKTAAAEAKARQVAKSPLPPTNKLVDPPPPPGARPYKPKSNPDDPLIGTTVGGNYKILSRLGSGGMGAVYEALQISMDRRIALKVLKPELAGNKEFAKGFLQEARMAGQLNHSALVQVHEVGESSGILYFSMEMVDGESFNDRLKREGRLTVDDTLTMAIAVSEALSYGTTRRIIHRDVKPHNIMIGKDGQIKLTDLGLAVLMTDVRAQGGGSKGLAGTPFYMAPEQAQRKTLDSRTDMYALGATIYHVLTGRPPFEGQTSLQILTKHATSPRPDPRAVDVTIPDSLAELTMQMMAVSMEKRPDSHQEVLARLKDIQQSFKAGSDARMKARMKARDEDARTERNIGTGIVRKKAQRSVAAARRKSQERAEENAEPDDLPEFSKKYMQSVINFAILAVALLAGYMVLKSYMGGSSENRQTPPKVVKPPVETESDPTPTHTNNPVKVTPTTQTTPNTTKINTPTNTQTTPTLSDNPAAAKDFKTALDLRDRALASNNFAGAKSALNVFISRYENAPDWQAKANKELQETQKLIADLVAQMLTEAESAAKAKEYRKATSKCTRLLSSGAGADVRTQAQALLDKMDTDSEPAFQKTMVSVDKSLDDGKLTDAMAILDKGLSDLGGTKWAETLNQRQLQILWANRFLRNSSNALKKITVDGKYPKIPVAGFGGQTVQGELLEIKELALKTRVASAELPFSFRKMPAKDVLEVATTLGQREDHLGLSTLFSILKNKDMAKQEIEKALKGEQAGDAAPLAPPLLGISNLHVYDFSKWQQQNDWDASAGAWSLLNGQYTLESPEGGETKLKPEALAGFSAKNAQIAYEMTPGKLGDGYYIGIEFGQDQRNLEIGFTASGYRMQLNGDTPASATGAWKPDGLVKVEITIKDNKVILSLNGKAQPPMDAPGAATLTGTVTFKMREATCVLDNVVLRNVE